MSDLVDLPRELLWDYRQAPEDPLWRLQRLAEWFPSFGRDRRSVRLLHEHRNELRIAEEVRRAIEMYEAAWREREAADAAR